MTSGAYRPGLAKHSYWLRRQRSALLERDATLAGYATEPTGGGVDAGADRESA